MLPLDGKAGRGIRCDGGGAPYALPALRSLGHFFERTKF